MTLFSPTVPMVAIDVTISGLPTGDYIVSTLHFDRLVPVGSLLFDILVDDALGTNQLKVSGATSHSGEPNYRGETFGVRSDGGDVVISVVGQTQGVRFNGLRINEGLIGDVNCDGEVNLLDVSPFIQAIGNGTFDIKADINGDGADNLLDVNGFIQLIGG